MRVSGKVILAAAALTCATSTSFAQEVSNNQVAAKTDWSVFVENDPKECWSVSTPTETVKHELVNELSVPAEKVRSIPHGVDPDPVFFG